MTGGDFSWNVRACKFVLNQANRPGLPRSPAAATVSSAAPGGWDLRTVLVEPGLPHTESARADAACAARTGRGRARAAGPGKSARKVGLLLKCNTCCEPVAVRLSRNTYYKLQVRQLMRVIFTLPGRRIRGGGRCASTPSPPVRLGPSDACPH